MKKSAIIKKCERCGDNYKVHKYRAETSKFCSYKCYWSELKQNPGPSAWKNGHGQLCTDEVEKIRREKISVAFKGEKHPNWQPDSSKLSYIGLHIRIGKKFGRAEKCERCGKMGAKRESDNRWNIDWANISGNYDTDDRSDWMGLCRSCHMKFDGIIPKNRQ